MIIIDGHTHLTEPIDILLSGMTKAGIDKAVICSSGVAKGETINSLKTAMEMMANISLSRECDLNNLDSDSIERLNNCTVDLVKKYPKRLIGFGKIDLRFPEHIIQKHIEQISAIGLSGIGEIIGVSKNMEKLKFAAVENSKLKKLPMFIHTDFPVTKQDIHSIMSLAEMVPEVPFILGHLGGDFWIDAIKGAKTYSNIYLDISEACNKIPVEVAAKEVPRKTIFGTDFPWETPEVALARLKAINLSNEDIECILAQNILSILPDNKQII